MKILSPAGNFESLKMAVYNGADEVYLGIDDFNARNIQGFTIDSLKEAVDFAHIFGVRVFLAINILFSDQEFLSAIKTVVDAYNLGVDAFIIQDLGLASYIHENYPRIELHASTQMGIHNLEGVRYIEQFGFKRVVLSRETPLEEIKRIRDNSSIEIEYFVQGALCVSFSGNCYLSSYTCNASGNRGKCKQLCRLPYTLRFKGKALNKGYLLSAKDFNMTKRLLDLEKAGVTSLKIEGRARRPYYVATATREYFNALNKKSANQENLALAFTRGYTEGYFNGNDGIISSIQSHVGIEIGKVEKVVFGNKFNEVYFSSSRDISPKSTLKFYDGQKEITTLSAFDLRKTPSGYITTTTQRVEKGLTVRLINDAIKEQTALASVKKRHIKIEIYAKENYPICAKVFLNGSHTEIKGAVLEKASNRPLTEQEIIDSFSKSEYFLPEICISHLDKVFMVKSALNAFRRSVFDATINELVKLNREKITVIAPSKIKNVVSFNDFCITEKSAGKWENSNAIYSPESYELKEVLEFVKNCADKGIKPYLDTPNFASKKDIEIIKEIIEQTKIGVFANNYYALTLSNDVVAGWGLNVYNSYTANVLKIPCCSAETDVCSHVAAPYMTLLHCPIKEHVGGSCMNCQYKDGYEYLTDDGKVLKLKRKKLSTCIFYLTK